MNRKKVHACYYQNENGYTFLNMIFSFFIYSIIISTLTIIFHFLLNQSQYSTDLRPFEWELFIIQLQRELHDSTEIEVNDSYLRFANKQGQSVTIQQYKNLIRRQVNGKGHEIYLLKVSHLKFKEQAQGIEITVMSEFGRKYMHIFRPYKDLPI